MRISGRQKEIQTHKRVSRRFCSIQSSDKLYLQTANVHCGSCCCRLLCGCILGENIEKRFRQSKRVVFVPKIPFNQYLSDGFVSGCVAFKCSNSFRYQTIFHTSSNNICSCHCGFFTSKLYLFVSRSRE